MNWILVILVVLLYVHLFNAIARLYFESGRTLTLRDLWRRFFPGISIRIDL
jgi:hypothetical protein